VRENARRYLRQKLGSLGTTIALGVLALMSGLNYSYGGKAGFTVVIAVFVMASGLVARDASSGALQMVLVRPVPRASYLLGRFLGAVTLLAGFIVAAVLVGFLLDSAARAFGWHPGGDSFPWRLTLQSALSDLLDGVLLVSILLFFSTFLRGLGDILAFVLASLVLSLLPRFAEALHHPEISRFIGSIRANLFPEIPTQLSGGRFPFPVAGAWMLALAAYITLACLVFNRREFSYGTD
jgi:ABC-type transport system involved in multi-copper enzyme maturation permease subunit